MRCVLWCRVGPFGMQVLQLLVLQGMPSQLRLAMPQEVRGVRVWQGQPLHHEHAEQETFPVLILTKV